MWLDTSNQIAFFQSIDVTLYLVFYIDFWIREREMLEQFPLNFPRIEILCKIIHI